MKKHFIISLFFMSLLCNGQKCGLMYGDFCSLASQKTLTITVVFDSLKIGKSLTEEAFIGEMKQKFEVKKKGGGEAWEKTWNEKRTAVFAMRLKKLCYKYAEMDSLAEAEYQLIVLPTHLHPGFESEDDSHFALLSGQAWLIKTSEPEKKLAKILFYNIKGEGIVADPTGGIRIGDAYAIAGRTIGAFMKSEIKSCKKQKK